MFKNVTSEIAPPSPIRATTRHRATSSDNGGQFRNIVAKVSFPACVYAPSYSHRSHGPVESKNRVLKLASSQSWKYTQEAVACYIVQAPPTLDRSAV